MSLSLFTFAINLISWLHHNSNHLLATLVLIGFILIQWWRDVIREARTGSHTRDVVRGFLIGFMLFLLSEIMLFFSFFWAFFHSSLSPNIEFGSIWPPVGITPVNCWSIPLLGSTVLLSSGFVFTLSHHALIAGNKSLTLFTLFLTIILGLFFILLQSMEYYYGEFTIADGVFGSVFYLTTGLHALHVMAGVIYITTAFIRNIFDQLTLTNHNNFEFAGAYWHLVDIVWLIVFLVFYWWGSPHIWFYYSFLLIF